MVYDNFGLSPSPPGERFVWIRGVIPRELYSEINRSARLSEVVRTSAGSKEGEGPVRGEVIWQRPTNQRPQLPPLPARLTVLRPLASSHDFARGRSG